jgi:hypothetical protein
MHEALIAMLMTGRRSCYEEACAITYQQTVMPAMIQKSSASSNMKVYSSRTLRYQQGMELRDYFDRRKAICGVNSDIDLRVIRVAGIDLTHGRQYYAEEAYSVADAMMKARENK